MSIIEGIPIMTLLKELDAKSNAELTLANVENVIASFRKEFHTIQDKLSIIKGRITNTGYNLARESRIDSDDRSTPFWVYPENESELLKRYPQDLIDLVYHYYKKYGVDPNKIKQLHILHNRVEKSRKNLVKRVYHFFKPLVVPDSVRNDPDIQVMIEDIILKRHHRNYFVFTYQDRTKFKTLLYQDPSYFEYYLYAPKQRKSFLDALLEESDELWMKFVYDRDNLNDDEWKIVRNLMAKYPSLIKGLK